MNKIFCLALTVFLFAACSNGSGKNNTTDSIASDSAATTASTANDSAAVKISDSATKMQPAARKMLDTVNTNISAVPMDSVKK